jgi:hypothetical protein
MIVTNKGAGVPLVRQWTHEDEHTLVITDDHGAEWVIHAERDGGISIRTMDGGRMLVLPMASNAVVVRAAP